MTKSLVCGLSRILLKELIGSLGHWVMILIRCQRTKTGIQNNTLKRSSCDLSGSSWRKEALMLFGVDVVSCLVTVVNKL